jgi:hypothetical protein
LLKKMLDKQKKPQTAVIQKLWMKSRPNWFPLLIIWQI